MSLDLEERNSLVLRLMPVATRVARQFTVPGCTVDDLQQECLLSLIQLAAKYEELLTPALATTALKRDLLNAKRHVAFLHCESLDAPADSSAPDGLTLGDTVPDSKAVDPETAAIDRDLQEKILRAVDNLPQLQRSVLIAHIGLFGLEAVSLRAFAAAHDLTPDRVERTFHSAIATCRRTIQ